MKELLKKKQGYLTAEAAIVFSAVFFSLLLIIFIGMVLYQQVNMNSLAAKASARGSVIYVTRPANLKNLGNRIEIMENGHRRLVDFQSRDPYRYIFGNKNGQVRDVVDAYVKSEIGKHNVIRGTNRSPSNFTEIKSNLFTRKVVVSFKYDYKMPIDAVTKYFGIDPIFTVDAKAVSTVSDPVEFIRNTDMCMDLIRHTGPGAGAIEKLGEIIKNVNGMSSILRVE